ncbi:WD repeat-containing protein 60 [Papilio machaon]|uniref:WD repeat-containing protein 60 n=1 Tax=Papilio machaon TaxID=76193 RepID=A0A0N0PC98_PAPMA|nr:WD repeat-containing protein 60 [Papilio machaon]
MQTPSRRNIEKIRSNDRVKTDGSVTSRKTDDDKPKKVSTTPRNYLQNTSTSDIYGKKKADVSQAPKKAFSSTLNTARNISPMKDYLKSTSTVSVRKTSTKMAAEKKVETKVNLHSARTPRVVKAQAPANVTVNSPILRRSVELKKEKSNLSTGRPKNITNQPNKVADGKSNMADIFLRQRSKTRTLDENEVKVLKADVVDNNVEMQNLSKKLSAKPKAFFVNLNGDEAKVEKEKSSEEDVSYEDDFESYESDFDSYHSESDNDGNSTSDNDQNSDKEESDVHLITKDEINCKENEEKMLDSGNFDLRDPQRSAQKKTPLDFIHEVTEDCDKKISLTDEGFQDMSTSNVSSMKTVHVDVLDRPLFIDFAVSKRNRKKRRVFQQLEQRAKDILSMVTLHEMTYTLFEMQPIPYDLYMATFGGRNSTQVAVQTFEDGVTEEVQTEEILFENKWTQHPIEFSKHIYVKEKVVQRSKSNDFLSKLSLLKQNDKTEKYDNEAYNNNQLRIFLEQKDGVGSDEILPHEIYKNLKVINVIISANKDNLLVTVHDKSNKDFQKCILCLWDLSGVLKEPIKLLIAPDNVSIGQFRGGADGIIVAALEDGSIHLWDLSEKATWINDTSDEKTTNSVEIDTTRVTQTEIDREWNLKNSTMNGKSEKIMLRPMQISAYTSSGINIIEKGVHDFIVGLEFIGETSVTRQDEARKIIAQICSLQRVGILTIYSLVQERSRKKYNDIGKAFWSKMALEKIQTIHLTEHLDVINIELENINKRFNLNAAKRRMSNKRLETKVTLSSRQSVDRRSVASADDTCSITCLEISQNGLPLMLAATDSGTVNLCSVIDFRVLLILDCGNVNSTASEKYKTDSKGRYISSVQTENIANLNPIGKERKMAIKSLLWPSSNPFDMVALLVDGTVTAWRLTNSDIASRRVTDGNLLVANGHTMVRRTRTLTIRE